MMDEEMILEVRNVSMDFHVSNQRADSLKEYLILRLKKQIKYQKFRAADNISFSMKTGESIGILGLNGSGKSTLLKIIAGILSPCEGSVVRRGNIAALIELGAGFDMELTGRENIFLSGAIMGYGRGEMKKHWERIVNFAELEDFIDVQLKNYSSGMLARLGFSLATFQIPDILVVDEVLAVGDLRFQRKCQERIDEMRRSGAGILFVSHSLEMVAHVCRRAIWLDGGRLVRDGEAGDVIEEYKRKCHHD